ncbi:MAG: peptidylprolyl isomerase [Planctomycetota bacterium]
MTWFHAVLLLLLGVLAGCSTAERNHGVNVARAWEAPAPQTSAGQGTDPTAHSETSKLKPQAAGSPAGPRARAAVQSTAPEAVPRPDPAPEAASPAGSGAVLAIVDGRPVTRERVVEMLLRGHGVGVLEQIIVLDAAQREAAVRGLTVSGADIEAEYDRALHRLLSPLPADEEAPLDREAGERVLERILSSRNVSRAEYMLGMQRNAYLRKIVTHEMQFTEAQLETEFERAYGARVKVRHLQVATLAEAEQMEKRLADEGADFAALAEHYSANPNTAPSGGLLRVFSQNDEDVPDLMRNTAFALEPGQHSAPLRIGEWFHILKVEERYPPGDLASAEVRDEVEQRLRERLTEPAMQQLHQTLLQQARVEILDPVLAEEFQHKRKPPAP